MSQYRKLITAGVASALVAVALLTVFGCAERPGDEGGEVSGVAEGSVIWTCSMHPQVRQTSPGDCPICGMDLIPVEDEAAGGDVEERTFSTSEAGRKLMEIQTAVVERKAVPVDVDLVGKIAYDEGRVSRIAAWVPGRIERLYVDYVGYEIERSEPMAELYSPGLMAAQQELIQSLNAYLAAAGEDALRRETQATLDAVRERLRLWGLSEEQVNEIEARGTAEPVATVLAPMGGTVVEKNVNEGQYVSTGLNMFTIADLSGVWVELSAYESDLAWLSEGQAIEFTVDALPGELFRGAVSLVEPMVDPSTRTVTVRAETDNVGGRLKPGMFVQATAHALAAYGGQAAPLVIPATAPLLTGRRAVVYVEVPDTEVPTYVGREVLLGPRAGDHYLVRSGLSEGERVVTNGAFKIDSALQIRAEASMMNPAGGDGGSPGGGGPSGHAH
jgi:Cu(I)/Ag(I) efflux system membrane fusion protein